jgi:hypothetical protein
MFYFIPLLTKLVDAKQETRIQLIVLAAMVAVCLAMVVAMLK